MKKVFITCLLAIVAVAASAQKFALIDMEYVLKNVPAYERANEQLNQVSKKWQAEVEALNTEASTLYKNYQNESVFLSQEAKKKKQEAIMQKEKEASDLKRKYFGPEGELFKKRTSLLSPIQEEIYNAVKDISELRGYSLVVDRASNAGIIFGSPKIDIVSVTGSVGAGESIMAAASKNITKVSLELGGKAPAIVMKDADLERAAQWIVDSRIGNNGQICNNAERVYVQKEVKEAFTEILVKKMAAVKVGDVCADDSVDMGPLVEARALESVSEKVERAIKQGAKLLCGGHRVGEKGDFYAATVLDNCTQDMDIIHEETFGPVIPLVEFDTLDQAIEWANDCEYGLASSIFTKDLNVAVKACRELEFGETYINREHFEAIQGFHAGVKKSGIGGADGKHGVDEYLVTHVTYLDTWEDM
jgi:Skp family chaperone for outer membrane proteins